MHASSFFEEHIYEEKTSACLEKKSQVLFLKGTTCLYSDVYVQRGALFACANWASGPTIAVKEAWLSHICVLSLLLTSPGFELMCFRLLSFLLLCCGETQMVVSLALE